MKRGLEVGGAVTQGGSRCAPLPWAILSLLLRGGRGVSGFNGDGLDLRFLRCLLWVLWLAPREEWISFRVFGVFGGHISGALAWTAVAASAEIWTGDFE